MIGINGAQIVDLGKRLFPLSESGQIGSPQFVRSPIIRLGIVTEQSIVIPCRYCGPIHDIAHATLLLNDHHHRQKAIAMPKEARADF
jgi:hypothetical protein